MNHLPPKSLGRAAVCAGTLALTLATCSACVGSSGPSNVSSGSTGGGTVTSPAAGATTPGGTGATGSGGSGGGATGSATTSGSGGGGTGGGPQACETQNLSASIADNAGGGAAGSDYVDLVLQNIGNTPCTVYGYPGVSFGAGSPDQQVGQPASRNTQVNPLVVTLIPNAHAFSVLRVVDAGNYPPSDCHPKQTSDLRVYPPNNTTLLYVPFPSTGCGSNVVTLSVEAMQPGTGA